MSSYLCGTILLSLEGCTGKIFIEVTDDESTNDKTQTVGSQALLQASKDLPADVVEIERAVNKGNKTEDSWDSHLFQAIERGKSRYDGPFFLVVLNKKERLLQNVVRRYFIDRLTCPLPEYDQTVFRYDPKSEFLDYLWTIPDWQACEDVKAHRYDLSPELHDLYHMVRQFEDGTLAKEALALNAKTPGHESLESI